MIDIFISYARNNKAIAKRLIKSLEVEGFDIYWDEQIEAGAEWTEELLRALKDARCVIVLWSNDSRKSIWVQGEAADAYRRDVYLPVLIEDIGSPKLFDRRQAYSIIKFAEQKEGGEKELAQLINSIKSRIGDSNMFDILEKVADKEPVTEKHLHIIHSCWRVDKEIDQGTAEKIDMNIVPYQIHVIIYGHDTALERIEKVDYKLPGYPEGHNTKTSNERSELFELKQLAYGFTIIQADIHLKDQPKPYRPILKLSRFINMSESGPRLFNEFISRSSTNKKKTN